MGAACVASCGAEGVAVATGARDATAGACDAAPLYVSHLVRSASDSVFHSWPRSVSLAAWRRPSGSCGRCSLQKLRKGFVWAFLTFGSGGGGLLDGATLEAISEENGSGVSEEVVRKLSVTVTTLSFSLNNKNKQQQLRYICSVV